MRAYLGSRIGIRGAVGGGLLVDGGAIIATGPRDQIESMLPSHGERIELGGGFLIPGFQDAHTHIYHHGRGKVRPALGDATSLGEALGIVRSFVEQSGDRVIIAEGYDQSDWPERRNPTREELDVVEHARPLIVRRVCGHVAVANSAAIDALGGAPTDIDRGSGLLGERTAVFLERDHFRPEREGIAKAILAAQADAFSMGITTIHEIEGELVAAAYESLDESGDLRLRVFYFHTGSAAQAAELKRRTGRSGNRFRGVGWKRFSDGSLGAGTAAVGTPYEDGGLGELLLAKSDLTEAFHEAREHDLPIAIHAIGDRAIDEVVGAYDPALGAPGGFAPRLEHAEMLTDETALVARDSGWLLSMQPNFPGLWGAPGELYETKLGARRTSEMNRFSSWIEAGLPVAFGSDAMPLDPFLGIASAVGHPVPGERIALDSAIHHYTATAESFVTGGGSAGVIATGKRADFLWFDKMPDVDEPLSREQLRMVVCEGEVVHER